jgi:hypothetical protein
MPRFPSSSHPFRWPSLKYAEWRTAGMPASGKQTGWIKVKCQAWREANRERHKLFERGLNPMTTSPP